MRRAFLLAAALAGAVPVVAATRDWSAVAVMGARGSYVIGNPAAKVKLTEYVSYTCPHCAHFSRDSAAVLKGRMIRSGSTSLEVRSSIHDPLDLAAATLARCIGPARFPRFHDALFAYQTAWLSKGVAWNDANLATQQAAAPEKRLRALADGSGLTALARANGMSPTAINQCFASAATANKAVQVTQSFPPQLRGTPSFEINGRFVENVDWAKLEPMLRAAGAK